MFRAVPPFNPLRVFRGGTAAHGPATAHTPTFS